MMRLLYSCIYTLLLPVIFIRLLLKSLGSPNYKKRWGERIGAVPGLDKGTGCIWVHSVSVGETLAAVGLIRSMQQTWPEKTIVVTTMTPTGSDQVKRVFGDSVYHVYAPYDLPCFVGRFLKAVEPEIAIIMETELWPNIIHGCFTRGIPTVIANARLSEKSLLGYQRLAWLSRPMMSQVSCYVAQTQADANRFKQLGVAVESIRVSGNIKFDLSINSDLITQRDALLAEINASGKRAVLVAASTHRGEDEIVLTLFEKLLRQRPGLLLVLVPRHPERFNEVAGLCQQGGFNTVKRSSGELVGEQQQVLLADTMGELLLLLGLADIAFVGGSFVPVGGHNMIEAAAWGVPVLTGPHLFNFTQASELLVNAGAMAVCEDQHQLEVAALQLLGDSELRIRQSLNAERVVAESRGALAQLLDTIKRQLEQS